MTDSEKLDNAEILIAYITGYVTTALKNKNTAKIHRLDFTNILTQIKKYEEEKEK